MRKNGDASRGRNHPEHFFRIASQGNIGAMATHLGLLSRYAKQYPKVNYIAKLNATTHLVSNEQQDPQSSLLWTVDNVISYLVDIRHSSSAVARGGSSRM